MTRSSPGRSETRFTLDTNILVYALDGSAGPRHEAASEIVRRSAMLDCWLALQAISEFYSVVTRKRLVGPEEAAAQALDWLAIFPHTAASADNIRGALAAPHIGTLCLSPPLPKRDARSSFPRLCPTARYSAMFVFTSPFRPTACYRI